jgi:hypothetical protein
MNVAISPGHGWRDQPVLRRCHIANDVSQVLQHLALVGCERQYGPEASVTLIRRGPRSMRARAPKLLSPGKARRGEGLRSEEPEALDRTVFPVS